MLYEGWMNSLLSGPATHATNIVSNTLTFLTKPFLETPATAVLESFKGKGRKAYFGEASAEIFGSWQGMKEGVRAAIKAWDTGLPSDVFSKIEAPRLNAIPGKIGEIIRIPTRALTAADEFFKSVVYRAELNRQAYSISAREGLKGEKRSARTAELVNFPTETMMDKAHGEALYRTFNKPLGKVGNQLMGLRNAIPFDAGRYLMPLLRTPTNIAKFALERTPFNAGKIAYDVAKGKLPKEQVTAEMAKPIVGTMIGMAVMEWAAEGRITGGGPKDPQRRDALYRSGWQPYSIRIGNNYYGYNRLEPVGSIMGMAADLKELIDDPYHERGQQSAIATKIAMSIARNLTSKTFVKGMSGALDALSDPARYGQQFVQPYAGSIIPNVVASGARAADPYYRQRPKTVMENYATRIPGMSQTLPPRIDTSGLPMEKAGNVITRYISPVPVTKAPERR
jgi:hypothetical protein